MDFYQSNFDRRFFSIMALAFAGFLVMSTQYQLAYDNPGLLLIALLALVVMALHCIEIENVKEQAALKQFKTQIKTLPMMDLIVISEARFASDLEQMAAHEEIARRMTP